MSAEIILKRAEVLREALERSGATLKAAVKKDPAHAFSLPEYKAYQISFRDYWLFIDKHKLATEMIRENPIS